MVLISGQQFPISKMMHSSSSVGAGPYDPGGAPEDQDTPFDTSTSLSTTNQNQHDMHEDASTHASDLQNKQKPEVSQQRRHRRPRPQHPSGEDLAQPCRNTDRGGSGWCDLMVEYDRTGGTAAELDDFSFAPTGTAAIVGSDNHGEHSDDDNDDEEEGENDYVWGPQHLFLSRYKSVRKNKSQSQRNGYSISGYGHGAFEAASAAAASARNCGRQLMGSLYSHLPRYPEHGGGGELEATAHSLDDDVAAAEEESTGIIENEWPYELAPPATVSMSRGYSNGSDGDSLTRDIISSSVHTETYIFEDNQNMIIPSDKDLDDNGSMPSDLFPTTFSSEDDNTSYVTAIAEANDGGEETALTGISLVDDDEYQGSANNCEEMSHSPQIRQVFPTQDSERDDDDYFYNADEPTTSLRSEVVEVLQEDIGRVNEAFLDTIHKTSALVEPIAAVARRQSTSSSPVRQRLSVLSQSALGITRSMSERASNTVTATIPTRQSLREKSGRLWNKAHEAEETILYAAHKAEKSAISTAGKAMSHIHVPVPSMKMPEAISDALESVEAAAEELRVNDVDVQSGVDDAELLSQLTAGAYA